MKCAWTELLGILPHHLRREVDKYGKETLLELRMRLGRPAEMVQRKGYLWLSSIVTAEDLSFTLNAASRYSPWSSATTHEGYVTAPGGHRIGLCGECVIRDGSMDGIRNLTSICIRICRDISGIAPKAQTIQGSVLILGPPGSGKTTLLRDLIREISDNSGKNVAVVDERGEIFPSCSGFETGMHTDVLTGCLKHQGIPTVLRAMGPAWIAVDEITAQEDCQALIQTGWCGVKLIATAHAADKHDLLNRPVYQPLVRSGLFETLLVLQPDKSWRMERIKL